jgi:thioredoxin 1
VGTKSGLADFPARSGFFACVCYSLGVMGSENVVELNDSNFDSVVSKALEPLLVDFWAPWCAPCRMLTPVVEEIAGENAGKFTVTKVNVDESPAVSEKFGIRSIPTLLFFKAGEKRDQTVGVLGKAEIIRRLQALA